MQLRILAELNIDKPFIGASSDLNLAIAVQRQMLPHKTKQLATIRYAGESAAARGIGGNYYDFLDLGPGTIGFLLADVSGREDKT
jgi:sigma-B regulation protein RsbU (phosphoserine phosphatase)